MSVICNETGPGGNPLMVDVPGIKDPFQLNVYPGVPPDGIAVADPLEFPQVAATVLIPEVNIAG